LNFLREINLETKRERGGGERGGKKKNWGDKRGTLIGRIGGLVRLPPEDAVKKIKWGTKKIE